MKIRVCRWLLLCMLWFVQIQGSNGCLDWDLSLVPLVGYRCDRISTSLEIFDAASTPIETNELIIDAIDVLEFGVRGKLTLAQHFSIRGLLSWGVISHGKYHEDLSDLDLTSQKNRAFVFGRLSQDHSISVGYAYPLICDFSIEGLVGWAYNKMNLSMDGFTENGLPDPTISKLYYYMRWQGPYIGGILAGTRCGVQCDLGYELHFPEWEAVYSPDYQLSFSTYADRRWARHGLGQVVYLDIAYPFLRYCTIGLRAQYQYWKAKNGRSQPINQDLEIQGIPVGQYSRVTSATWRSAGIQLNLGVAF